MNMLKSVKKNPVGTVLVTLVLALVGYLIYCLATGNCKRSVFPILPIHTIPKHTVTSSEEEAMTDALRVTEGFETNSPANESGTYPAEENQESSPEVVEVVEGESLNQLPSECYPKDVLSASQLLPGDANTLYAQVNPNGQGGLSDQNFLTAGYHVGVNTVGQSLRNANLQLRSEPANPQVKVSPFLQTTIEPDINRRPLEIGGC